MESRPMTSNVSLQSRADLRIPVSVITDPTNVVAVQAIAGKTIKERRTALPLLPLCQHRLLRNQIDIKVEQ